MLKLAQYFEIDIFDEKNKEVRTLKQQEINLKKRELELEEKAKDQELLVQQQLLEKQKEIEDKARAKEREANALKEREFQKQLEDQKHSGLLLMQ